MPLTIHLHLHGDTDAALPPAVVEYQSRVLARLANIEERLSLMATKAEFESLRTALDAVTDNIAAAVVAVTARITDLQVRLDEVLTNAGVSSTDEAAILRDLDGVRARLVATSDTLTAVGKPVTLVTPTPAPVSTPTPVTPSDVPLSGIFLP